MRRFFCSTSACIVGLFCFIGIRVAADSGGVDAVLSRMETAEKSVSTLRFSFTQTTVVSLTGESTVTEGDVVFRRPSSFQVVHKSPRPMTVVCNGETLWIHNPARNQVLVDRWTSWSSAVAGLPSGLSPLQSDAATLRKKYNVSLDRREGNVDVLLLTPKESGSGPAVSLRLWVPDSGLPEKTELISKSVKTLLETKALEINPVLPKDFFSFTIPPGADVLSDKKGTDK